MFILQFFVSHLIVLHVSHSDVLFYDVVCGDVLYSVVHVICVFLLYLVIFLLHAADLPTFFVSLLQAFIYLLLVFLLLVFFRLPSLSNDLHNPFLYQSNLDYPNNNSNSQTLQTNSNLIEYHHYLIPKTFLLGFLTLSYSHHYLRY